MPFFLAAALIFSSFAFSAESLHPSGPQDCGEMESWDYDTAMCTPLAMAGMPMRMLMVHGNGFLNQSFGEKPRGRDALTLPDMFMADLGTSVGDRHYVNLDFMGTLEKFTYPRAGYPELLQIGEDQADGTPFLDAQHPHSTPVMGLTLSDTISLGEGQDHLKFWFAPRGQSTDGPVAFMHRPTGMVNPDAPLGHHIGQDVGHITSTVIGAAGHFGDTTFEASTFHGTEPEPTKVDLPFGAPNSYAARLIQQFNPALYAMASAAYVNHPEGHDAELNHIWRLSASVYQELELGQNWHAHNALIFGRVIHYDHAASLASFGEEFWLAKGNQNLWGRLEILQRTPRELALPDRANQDQGRWVTALTLGYTQALWRGAGAELSLGGSATKDFLPAAFRPAYGGDPWAGKVFLQAGGMRMWEL